MTRGQEFKAFLAANEGKAWSYDEAMTRWSLSGEFVMGVGAPTGRPIYDDSTIGKTRKPTHHEYMANAAGRLAGVLSRFTDTDLDHTRRCVLALADDPDSPLPWSHARRLVSWARIARGRSRGNGSAPGAPKDVKEYLRLYGVQQPETASIPPAPPADASEWSPADTGTLPGLGVGALIPPPESDHDPETLASTKDLRDLGITLERVSETPPPDPSADDDYSPEGLAAPASMGGPFADRDPNEETAGEFAAGKLQDFVTRAFLRMSRPHGPGFASITIRLDDAGRDDDDCPVLGVVVTEEWDTHSDPLRRDPLPMRHESPLACDACGVIPETLQGWRRTTTQLLCPDCEIPF